MTRNYVEISRHNEEQLGKDRKSRMSQVAMYADTAHFIYELLQNADDAEATEISFRLAANKLVVEHNGKAFNEDNVKAISYFGKGKTEVTAIGHFGLGFKSVFAYTASPKIYSTDDDFELVNLYTLRPIARPNDLARDRTRFVLPFDHLQRKPVYIETGKLKTPDKAYAEIGAKLKAIGGGTLLFTKTLRTIQWSNGRNNGQYLRKDSSIDAGGRESVIECEGADKQYFLVYEEKVQWTDASGVVAERRPIAIAVELDKPYIVGGRVTGAENQKLWVFFPTDKDANMGLIAQGPYRTTPARDNIPSGDEFNQYLVNQTASLIRTSLTAMKILGVVDADLLSRLPLDETKFNKESFLRPLYDSVRVALKDDPLLPTSTKGYVPATKGKLARGQKLTELISPSQLSSLYGKQDLEWLDPSITADAYPMLYRYLVGLKQHNWDADWTVTPLMPNMEVRVEDFAEKLNDKFMDVQTDEWVVCFYMFLQEGRGQLHTHFLPKPFIRLENDKHVTLFGNTPGKPNAYLPTDALSELPTVKRTLVKEKKVVEFLNGLGLKAPDFTDEVIETVVPRYTNIKEALVAVWQEDFKKILAALDCDDPIKRFRLVEMLKKASWILAQSPGAAGLSFATSEKAYVRSKELLSYFANSPDTFFLAEGYYTEKQIETLAELDVARLPRIKARKPDFRRNVTLADGHGWHKRGLNYFDPNWQVDGLEKALERPSIDVSAFVWNRIVVTNWYLVKGSVESSSRKTFEEATRNEQWSATGKFLHSTPWLPDEHGTFGKPGSLMLTQLSSQFDRESQAAKNAAMYLGMKRSGTDQALDALAGGSARKKALLQRLMEAELDDKMLEKFEKILPHQEPASPLPTFRDAVQELQREMRAKDGEDPRLEVGGVENVGRYTGKLKEEVEERRRTQGELRAARFVVIREREDNKEARSFLYAQYEGTCQVSGRTFKKADGANYFVAVSLVPYRGASYLNHAGNMLCLSAEMAAKFKYANFAWLDDIGETIKTFKSEKEGGSERERRLRIRIAGDDQFIKYSEKHFLRLKALWETLA